MTKIMLKLCQRSLNSACTRIHKCDMEGYMKTTPIHPVTEMSAPQINMPTQLLYRGVQNLEHWCLEGNIQLYLLPSHEQVE